MLSESGVRRLGIEDDHVSRLQALPWHHHDPLDRLLIAQAPAERLTVPTADRASADHTVPIRDTRSRPRARLAT